MHRLALGDIKRKEGLRNLAVYSISVHAKLKQLRWKYRNDVKGNKALQKLVDRFTVVYPNFLKESSAIQREWDKNKAKRKRIMRYVHGMSRTHGTLYLLSLTFSDEVLKTTTAETRKQNISRWLDKHTVDYMACIDFGRKNKREHYHAIVALDIPLKTVEYRRKTYYEPTEIAKADWYPYGFMSVRCIDIQGANAYKTANYALKASTYAFKASSADSAIKPFHKRGVEHLARGWETLGSDDELPF